MTRWDAACKVGGMTPGNFMKKQVVIHIDPATHARLKKRAQKERRKLGDQLLWQALQYEESALASEPQPASCS